MQSLTKYRLLILIILSFVILAGCSSDNNDGGGVEQTTTLNIVVSDEDTGEAIEEATISLEKQAVIDSSVVTDETGKASLTVKQNSQYILNILQDNYYNIYGYMVNTGEKARELNLELTGIDPEDSTYNIDPDDEKTLSDIGTEQTAINIEDEGIIDRLDTSGVNKISVHEAGESEIAEVESLLETGEHPVGSYVSFSLLNQSFDSQSSPAADNGSGDFSGFIEAKIALDKLFSEPEDITLEKYHMLVIIKNSRGTGGFRQLLISSDGEFLSALIPVIYKDELAGSITIILTYDPSREVTEDNRKIISVGELETIEVDYGTEFTGIDLPERVLVTRTDDNQVKVPVNWDKNNTSPPYNPQQPGDYLFTGELDLTDLDSLINSDGLSPSVVIRVAKSSDRAPVLEEIGNKSIDENEELKFTVSADDPDGDSVALSVSNLPDGASFDTETGQFSWTPDYDQEGTYDVSFTAQANGKSDSEEIAITVNNVNRAPQAADDSATTDKNTEVTVDLLANDSDPDGDSLSVSSIDSTEHGQLADNGDGTITYTPDENYTGEDSFSYTISDGNGGTDTGRVSITVVSDNEQTSTLTVTIQGEGAVTPAAGTYEYEPGEEVTLTAESIVGWDFSHWEVDNLDKNSATITVTMDQDKTVTAVFQEVIYTLTTTTDGAGTVTPESGEHSFHKREEVELTATPAADCSFSHWEGDVADSSSAETTVMMDENKAVTAVFSTTISGTITGINSGDAMEGITINFSDGSSTTPDSNGDWSKNITGTVTVTPSGSDEYYGEFFEPASKEVSGPDDNVDFEFSGYRLVTDFGEEEIGEDITHEDALPVAVYNYDTFHGSQVVIGQVYQIHGYEDSNNNNNYDYSWTEGEKGAGGSFEDPEFDNIMDLAVNDDRYLCIADTDNNRIIWARAWSGTFWDTINLSLDKPKGVAAVYVDGDDIVYIADTGNKRIVKLVNETYEKEWDTSEWDTGEYVVDDAELEGPRKIAVDSSDNIYVVDNIWTGYSLVYKYNGANWSKFIEAEELPSTPVNGNIKDIAVDTEDNVYMLGGGKIFIYDSEGEKITVIETDISLQRMDIDDEGNIFCTSHGKPGELNKVHKFSPVD